MRIFDEYTNILKYMYGTRFNSGSTRAGTSRDDQSTPIDIPPYLISTIETGRLDKFRKRTNGGKDRTP
jgi:hypothetical protein